MRIRTDSRSPRGSGLRRSLLAIATSCLLCSSPAGQAQVALPSLGDSVSQDLDVGSERNLGDQVMRQIRPDPDFLDDPLLQEYLLGIWDPLVVSAKLLGNISDETIDRFAWEIFLVRDRSVNAFALPGGFVGVHLGLIAMTSSRDELASVLAHELSHVTQRHIARRIAGDSRNSMLAMAAMLAGLIAASRSGSIDAANAAIVGPQALAAQASLNFSRDMEREADRVGFQVLSSAGYTPSGMFSMFEKMEQAHHLMDSGSYPYLRTHPLTSERIGDARTRLGAGDFQRPINLAEHALMAARSRVLMDPRAEVWAQLQNLDAGAREQRGPTVGRGFEQLSARYTSCLASIKMRDFPRAARALESAEQQLQQLGNDPKALRLLRYLRAELAQAQSRAGEGFVALDSLPREKSRPLLMERSRLALVDPRGPDSAREVADELQTWVSLNPKDVLAWSQLGLLWEKLEQPLRAVRALGEARYAMGDLGGAIDRMRSGLRQSRGRDADPVEASVIDARLRTMLYERRQILIDMYPRGIPPGAELP